MENKTITAISGILVGHATDTANQTGCTAVLCPEGFTPGVAVPGFATGSREIELLRPESLVESVHGIVLSGGSAFGLGSADGAIRFLREKGHGFVMPHGVIPLVSGAVIYDLDMNRQPGLLPDANMGFAAAAAASSAPVEQGSVGVGTGARCGRLYQVHGGADCTEKAGLGSALVERKGVLVGALVVVNAMGNVHDPDTGAFLAGGRDSRGHPWDREALLSALAEEDLPRSNTVLTVVATNAPLSKVQTGRLARMAGTGLARVLRPAHLIYDGDIVFALAGKTALDQGSPWTESLLGAMGAEVVARAAVNATLFAQDAVKGGKV